MSMATAPGVQICDLHKGTAVSECEGACAPPWL